MPVPPHIKLLLLRKPRPCDHTQLLPDRTKRLRRIRDDDNRLLHRTPGDILGSIEQFRSIELARTAYAEEGSRGSRFLDEGEVGELF